MSEYVVPICGGLGDVFVRYLMPGDCGYVADLKRREPQARVVCQLMSTNPQSAAFLVPWVDDVVYQPWDGDYRGFLARTRAGRIDQRLYTWERPPIALTEEERRLADSVEPFVAIHPFAGTLNRDWRSRVDLVALVNALCDAGLTVVMLGGSSRRTDGEAGRTTVTQLIEQFDMDRPGLVNMVNRQSVRLQAYMATRAARFIGSFSCYHCAAFAVDVPALVLADRGFKGFFETPHPVYGTISARPSTEIHYFEDGGIVDRIVRFVTEQRN